MENYYEILRVQYSATTEDIKSAYRTLAKRWHPDVCQAPNAHQQFVQIGEAYEILSNPTTRANYDALIGVSQSGYAGQQRTYSESSRDFNQARHAAQQRAEANARKPLEELLNLLLAAGVEVGRVAWKGEKAVQDESYSFGTRLAIGIKGCLLILMIIFTFTGIAPPITLPIGFIIYKSLTHNNRFIGIGPLLSSTIIFILFAAFIIMVLVLLFFPQL